MESSEVDDMEDNIMRYMRDGLKDSYGIQALQDKILEIMVYIDQFCNRYDIDYCLMAGSALGARRHGGFIPWDDDIDIYMSEADYDCFQQKFKKYGDHEQYYLQEWGSVYRDGKHYITMAKVRLNHTLVEESTFVKWKMHKGIFVDIFIIHNTPDTKLGQIVQYIWGEILVLKGLSVREYCPKNWKDKILLTTAKMFPLEWIKYHGLKNNYKYQHNSTRYISGFIDTRDFSKAVFPRTALFPTKYADFEKVSLRVPNNIDQYLEIQFGSDYMEMPPEEKRQVGKHAIQWSIKIEEDVQDFSDEEKLI